ncbi:MAG: hypothetical protein A2Z16_06730 [Chloroflexi bacterium RBG_16_54_18]|nr:MAG: hypothetical protein A2Z16_06730 [Chloroflexi bacterium RBG_16_54_18]
MIRLVVLGAGTAIPMTGYSPAGHLVQSDAGFLLVDIGPGTLSRLAAAGVDYRELEQILITHHHSDHTLDLVTLIQAYDSTSGWVREEVLHLTGGRGTGELFDQLMLTYPGIGPTSYRVEIHEMMQETLEFSGWEVRSALTGHTPDSLGYRLEVEGKVVVFSGDATLTKDLVTLADQADIFVCECSFPGSSGAGDHLAAEQVGWIAAKARVKKLVLVHMYPHTLKSDLQAQIGKEYSGQVVVAMDGLELFL